MDYKEIKSKSSNEMRKELAELRDKVREERVKLRTNQSNKPQSLRAMRKDIARILTALRASGADSI